MKRYVVGRAGSIRANAADRPRVGAADSIKSHAPCREPMDKRGFDPMGILPSQEAPDITGEAHDWPDEVREGPGDGARVLTVREEADLDALGDAEEAWARFEEWDEEGVTEALVYGARAVVVPLESQAAVAEGFDLDAFLFEDGETLLDHEGKAAYLREADVWRRTATEE